MDVNVESGFVRECIKKEYRERVQFELQSKKHRQKAMSRFAHDCGKILQNGYKMCKASELAEFFDAVPDKALCYLISDGEGDGTTMPLKQAKELMQNTYMPLILISSHFTVIKPEAEGGQPTFYVFMKGDTK